jgi:archaellum biogenesis ATPase FlaH/CheY-like chemotaxis protein
MAAKILIVDDEPAVLELLVDWLESDDHEVWSASDGYEGLKLLREVKPDLAITDIQMPGLDGYLFCQHARRISNIPVLIITGVPQEVAVLREMDVGTDHYLTKPIGMDALLDQVAELLGQRPAGESSKLALESTELDDERSRIMLGIRQFDQALRGGIPLGSMTLIEGSPASGKTVICEHLTSAALKDGPLVAFYTSAPESRPLAPHMASLGLEAPRRVNDNRFDIFPFEPPHDRLKSAREMFDRLLSSFSRMSEAGVRVIIIDDIREALARASRGEVIRLFESCKDMSKRGLTFIVAMRTSSVEGGLMGQLHSMFDTHLNLSLRIEGHDHQADLVNLMEVSKSENVSTGLSPSVYFRVNPDQGAYTNSSLDVIPIRKVKV